LSSTDKANLQERDQQKLSDSYFSLLNQWADPIISHSLEVDPTLSLAAFLKERLITSGNWKFQNQQLMLQANDTNYIPIFVTIKQSFSNIRDSVEIYKELQSIKIQYRLESENSEILMAGMLLHSASASMQAQSEISRFGLFSLVSVIIIVVLAFRAFTPLLACLAVIGSALVSGLLALTLIFDAIHLLAFVFAVSILGIAVDYGFHILVLRQYTQSSSTAIRKKVFLPLTIALMSTLAGYCLFFTTPVTLLHQVVVFVGFGLIGAYLSALLLLPSINFSSKGTLFSININRHFAFAFIALLLFITGIPMLNFDDNVSNLNTQSSILVHEEQKVSQLTGENIYPHLVLVSGNNQQILLENTRELTQQLRATDGQIKSISDWQLPLKQQQQNFDLFKAGWQSGQYQYLEEYIDSGNVLKQLNQIRQLTQLPGFIAENLGLSITQLNDKYWTALLLAQPLSEQQQVAVKLFESAEYVNLPQALSEQLGHVRDNLFAIILPAVLIILLILSFYFGFISALLMIFVPVLSAGLALEITQFYQSSLNIFNVLACLLIITLAIDYVVFFRSHGTDKLISHTISLSALSSALTFGVMFFSQTPAVSSFGITLLIGITIAWFLSHATPLTNHLKKRTKK